MIFSDCLPVFFFFVSLFYIATCKFSVKIKFFMMLYLLATLKIFGEYDFGIFYYCNFLIDILEFRAQTFEPAHPYI